MKTPHWAEFDKLYDKEKCHTETRWVCFLCHDPCFIILPRNKHPYHCPTEEEKE